MNKNIQMTQRNATNDGWDNVYPTIKVDNIVVNTSVYKLNKDSNGINVEVQIKRQDGTLYLKSVLSGGTSPLYTTRTETYYKTDGTTVDFTKVYTRTYDLDGNLTSEVVS